MGLILDTSILIADERAKFDMPGFLRQFPTPQPLITAITASELLHGVLCPLDEHGANSMWSKSSLPCSCNPSISLRRAATHRSEEHTSELQSLRHLVCR